ncbi:MAG TPA: molybdopterin-dependent oxidoreductase, partial [Actinomycetota bacterium]|nr:molybdopterin-dependent oxidoreductase [Actinomycetota bacterium]
MSALGPLGIEPTGSEGITPEELALAARNRGMPLEALRYDVTPAGMHYLLTHYDIPHVDEAEWRLRIGGAVESPMSLALHELQAMPSKTLTVTMECAGNGRALLNPRPVSQPWRHEAVSTATWTGVPLRNLLEVANPLAEAVDLVFTGADHGTERGIEQDYQRGLSLEDAGAPEVLLAYAMNGEPLPPQHGAPLRLLIPGWYGMASVKWLHKVEAITEKFDG